jgi:hypothetical protein
MNSVKILFFLIPIGEKGLGVHKISPCLGFSENLACSAPKIPLDGCFLGGQ